MHMNRHVYTESKSPMRSVGRSKERVDTQEYNYNNSIDTLEDNINSEPILNSGILENIMLNNSNN